MNEVLVLLLALLESGNIAVQNGFAQLQGSPDNALFPTLEYMLRSAAVLYKERYRDSTLCAYFILSVK